VVGVAGAALALSGEREATAYVQFRTAAAGIAMTWRPACFPLTLAVYPGTFSQMTSAEIAAAVTAAAGAWSSAANACTFLSFQVQLVSGPAPRVARDGTNTIVFRNDSWCALDAAGVCNPDLLYDPAAPAMTTIYASATTGEIREADIEINAFHFTWADRVTHPELSDRYDLQNTLASQMGHLLGFDWACAANPAVRPIDHTGQPVVECASAPASLREATMYPAVLIDNIERRTLAADDQAAVCATYPAAATTCPADAGQACTCPAFSTGVDGGQDAAATLDAGDLPDAAAADRATADGGGGSDGDGCSCAAGHPNFGPSGAGLLLVSVALVAITRRHRVARRKAR
jgi:hypothetical protein